MVIKSLEAESEAALFTVMIPTWNNLAYLQACVQSIRKYSTYRHQLLVHVNEGTDGTLEWLQKQNDIVYSYSERNIGICQALNRLRKMPKTSYLF